MTIAEKLKQEGKKERDREIAIKMLKDDEDIEKVIRYTTLSQSELEEIKKSIED